MVPEISIVAPGITDSAVFVGFGVETIVDVRQGKPERDGGKWLRMENTMEVTE